MNVDKLLQKYQSPATEEDRDIEAVDDQGAFGLVRSPRERALFIELRKKDGTVLAIPYSHIEQIKFTSADGITICASIREIQIKGKNLNQSNGQQISLFSGLCRHRIVWIQEYARTAKQEHRESTVQVDSIAF